MLFIALSLLGPLLQFLIKAHLPIDSPVRLTLTSFILLVWPAQVLGLYEGTVGRANAIAIAILANIALFALVGAIVFLARNSLLFLAAIWIVLCVLVAVIAAWIAGFDIEYLDLIALLGACGLYGLGVAGGYGVGRAAVTRQLRL